MNPRHPVRGTFMFLWLCSVALVLGGCAHASSSAGLTPTVPAPRVSPSALAPCQTQHLRLAFDKSAAAMNNDGVQLVLVNQSKEGCTLFGYAALQLLDGQSQPIQARVVQSTGAYLYITNAPYQFVLQAGRKAYFMVEWGGNLGDCAPPVAFLRVTPPGNQTPLLLAFRFCPDKDYVEISPLEPGVFI